jgi:hypothetical protein
MPTKNRIKPVGRRGTGAFSGAGTGDFTNAQDLKNRFFANTASRRQSGDKSHGDATYWTEGRCNWGGSHNLMEDCQSLANFFNSLAEIDNDIQEMKLSMDENEFNTRKQQLTNKLQENINKCNVTSSWSIANVCCIWNDYFGSFLKKFLDKFKSKLQSNLTDLQSIEPKHQREILELEAELRTAETKYNDSMTKAAQETNPVKKAQFIATAQAAENEIKKAKAKLAQNPLSKLTQYSYLNDLGKLIDGNLTSDTVNQPSDNTSRPTGSGNTSNPFTSNSGSNSRGGWTGGAGSPSNIQNNQQLLIFAVIAIVIIFLLLNKKEQEEELYY